MNSIELCCENPRGYLHLDYFHFRSRFSRGTYMREYKQMPNWES